MSSFPGRWLKESRIRQGRLDGRIQEFCIAFPVQKDFSLAMGFLSQKNFPCSRILPVCGSPSLRISCYWQLCKHSCPNYHCEHCKSCTRKARFLGSSSRHTINHYFFQSVSFKNVNIFSLSIGAVLTAPQSNERLHPFWACCSSTRL